MTRLQRLGFRLGLSLIVLTRFNTLLLLVAALVLGHLTTTQLAAVLVGIVVLFPASLLVVELPLNLY